MISPADTPWSISHPEGSLQVKAQGCLSAVRPIMTITSTLPLMFQCLHLAFRIPEWYHWLWSPFEGSISCKRATAELLRDTDASLTSGCLITLAKGESSLLLPGYYSSVNKLFLVQPCFLSLTHTVKIHSHSCSPSPCQCLLARSCGFPPLQACRFPAWTLLRLDHNWSSSKGERQEQIFRTANIVWEDNWVRGGLCLIISSSN